MVTRMLWALLAFAPLMAAPAAAQAPAELTPEAAARIAAFHNRPTTSRTTGLTRIAAGTAVGGDVAVVGGPVIVEGTVRGDIVVINGDLSVPAGGRIEGAATVTGGAFAGDTAAVAGGVTVHREALRFRTEDGRIVALEPRRPGALTAGGATPFGRTELMLSVDGSYNRVEGLPITLGPRIEVGLSNPTVLDARLIYRTRSGLRIHPDEFGHIVRLEQFLGGHRALAIGASLHNVVDPIERVGLSDVENSLATFILHRDYHDHYTRRGWGAHVRSVGRTRPFEAGLEYRDETHETIDPGTPWSLISNDDPWRPQPQVAEGEISYLRGWFRWDTRNDRVDPSAGWLVDIAAEQGLEGELRVREPPLGPPPPEPVFRGVGAEYTALELDVRRYLRLSPRTRLALRLYGGGSPDDGALPPQRQHVLGGEGSLPGFRRFAQDCGARDAAAMVDGFHRYYGCDRAVLLQGELRLAVFQNVPSLGRRLGLDFDLLSAPEIVLFADAGRAWIEPESLGYRARTGPSRPRADAGLGLRLGRLGLYLALPVGADDGGRTNVFVRLGPRL